MRQTWAIFVDAYRELNAKKLFWITLGLSFVVAAAFAAVGINDRGLSIFWYTIESEMFNSRFMPPAEFYKTMYIALGVKFWISWIATILALISTGSAFPDFLSSGAIEMSLSKPIARARLFLTKYLAGLLFVAAQITLFSFASFLVLGIRGGVWSLGLFWAVPFVLLFFSYLFSVCVLIGVLTRSGIASILLTLLVWLALWAVRSNENLALYFLTRNEVQQEAVVSFLDDLRERDPVPEFAVSDREQELEELQRAQRSIGIWHDISYAVYYITPKTGATLDILTEYLASDAQMEELRQEQDPDLGPMLSGPGSVNDEEVQRRVALKLLDRSNAWIIGTSLAFEVLLVLIAMRVFVRRDF